ncbi:MAG: prepilin-type N-terminal cleavage/methylation domain-containing protein [Verrucomicrobia bacterium]|nr:prepilin-type N-terminal cleavage/methylation domain-containing protein [Verrucomicrobiota bacterium]
MFGKTAFSLIELLVVLAVLGLLVMILLPVGVRSLEAARRAECESNLRQLFLANAATPRRRAGMSPPRRIFLGPTVNAGTARERPGRGLSTAPRARWPVSWAMDGFVGAPPFRTTGRTQRPMRSRPRAAVMATTTAAWARKSTCLGTARRRCRRGCLPEGFSVRPRRSCLRTRPSASRTIIHATLSNILLPRRIFLLERRRPSSTVRPARPSISGTAVMPAWCGVTVT